MSVDPVDGSQNITLDRTNLVRLANMMATIPDDWDAGIDERYAIGWNSAVQAILALAESMPNLYGDDGCLVMTTPPAADREARES